MIDPKAKEDIEVIRRTGVTNMCDTRNIRQIAVEFEMTELLLLLDTDRRSYMNYILFGEGAE